MLASIDTWQTNVGLFISLCIAVPLAWKFLSAIYKGLKSIEKILHQVLPNSGESVLDRALQAATAAKAATIAAAAATEVSERTDKTVNQIQIDVKLLTTSAEKRDERMVRIEDMVEHDLKHTKAQEENFKHLQKQINALSARIGPNRPLS